MTMRRNNNVRTVAGDRRAGFTLVELIVVIVIILLISVMVLPSVLGALNDRKFTDATRTLQAVLLGARERAIQSGNVVGIRLIRDDNDPWTVTQLLYVTVPEPFSVGRVSVTGTIVTPAGAVDPHFEQVDPGKDGTVGTYDDIRRVVTGVSFIRFDHSGKLYRIDNVSTSTPATLTLNVAPTTVSPAPAQHEYQIFGAPVPLAQADPILLPEGMVIDLRTPAILLPGPPGPPDRELLRLPRSLGIPNQYPALTLGGPDGIWGNADDPPVPPLPANWPPMEILFAPTGAVVGQGATSALIHFWLGERGDYGAIGPDARGGTGDDVWPNRPHKMVTLNTRTGLVLVTDDPQPVGTPLNSYVEVYGRAEQAIGVSYLP